jgi:molecular chaperone DnaK (HSP70)
MSDPEDSPSPEAAALDERLAIGISFGNSYSSIAITSSVRAFRRIAQEIVVG